MIFALYNTWETELFYNFSLYNSAFVSLMFSLYCLPFQAVCVAFHSHLAIVTSAEDNAFLKSEIQNLQTSAAYWIDGTDIEVEDIWRWTFTGERVTFVNWGSGQPNNGHAANCMSLYGGLSFDMADEHCSTNFNYICQMSDADASELIG
ncbi:perlucin-like protein [Mizuhopecten yessoensis]|uniref:perlucin-like protein n=1 Tax=Mizuhopecten yessoensis TaxID=6573 RepID=UPI000B45B080|nr:perlucin-like protein [Mizuhopecten yessoensis]